MPMLKFLLAFLLFFCFFLFPSARSKQFYDKTPCGSTDLSLGSRYKCGNTTSLTSCNTYIAYRSRAGFNTVSNIANLFGVNSEQVLHLNNLSDPLRVLEEGREVLLPVRCSCSGGFFRLRATYVTPSATTYDQIACDVFEGLVKLRALANANSKRHRNPTSILQPRSKLNVPIKCACPDENEARDGFRFLVSYPLEEFDEASLLARKFNVSVEDILLQNRLNPGETIFPNTSILIPVRSVPTLLLWNISSPSDKDVSFIPTATNGVIETKGISRRYKYIIIGTAVGIFSIIFAVPFVLVFYRKWSGARHEQSPPPQSSSGTSLFAAGMSKYSLRSYDVEELREATRGFSEDARLGSSVHKGTIGGGGREVVVEKKAYRDARRIVAIHSKINHSNIVKLDGVCYGRDESYLVFEFAERGCLRDCLREGDMLWRRRTQIAFDVAVGLHYIHHCTTPRFVHMNLSSENILIAEDWRAKISNLGDRVPERVVGDHAAIAPELLNYDELGTKVDVFAFGVIAFELLSGEGGSSSSSSESLSFLRGGSVTAGLDQIERIVDPRVLLEADYAVGEALCLCALAKACLEDDPTLRPSMNDILKILARMVRLYSIRSR